MARIVVIGSVARDEVVHLHEPLRVGTHLEGTWKGPRLGGGAGCTAVPLAYAGHQVTVIGAVGNDEVGGELIEELAATGVDTGHLTTVEQLSTRSIIMVNGTGERTIVNVERTTEDEPPTRLLGIDADCVYVRSRQLDLTPLLSTVVPRALVVAHVPPNGAGSRPAHVLVASDADVGEDVLDAPLAAGRTIAGPTLEWMVVTHGPRGVTAFADTETIQIPALTVRPVDTTGAGDSFAAGLLHALTSGAPMRHALEVGARWGAEATLWHSSILPREAVAKLTGT